MCMYIKEKICLVIDQKFSGKMETFLLGCILYFFKAVERPDRQFSMITKTTAAAGWRAVLRAGRVWGGALLRGCILLSYSGLALLQVWTLSQGNSWITLLQVWTLSQGNSWLTQVRTLSQGNSWLTLLQVWTLSQGNSWLTILQVWTLSQGNRWVTHSSSSLDPVQR